jgi:hypothetical protein
MVNRPLIWCDLCGWSIAVTSSVYDRNNGEMTGNHELHAISRHRTVAALALVDRDRALTGRRVAYDLGFSGRYPRL